MSTWVLHRFGAYESVLPHAFTKREKELVERVLGEFGIGGDLRWTELGDIRAKARTEPIQKDADA